MDRKVTYHPLVETDLLEASAWYDDRSPDLGSAFSRKVREAIDSILRNPTTFLSTDRGVYYRRVDRFPYIVIFRLPGNEIRILGVIHTSRSLKGWRKSRGDA